MNLSEKAQRTLVIVIFLIGGILGIVEYYFL